MSTNRTTIGYACNTHGYFSNDHCPICRTKGINHSYDKARIHGDSIKGWFEHIDTKPIYIESKAHLARECDKRGLLAKAIMKPKSQGKGFENRRR